MADSQLSEGALALGIVSILLVPLAAAALSLISTGLNRSRSAAHSMLVSLCIAAVAAIAYSACGFAWQGLAGHAGYGVMVGGKLWNWIGAERLFLLGVAFDGSRASLAAWFGMLSAGVAAMIPLGSGNDRWRLGACCASTALFAGWTYPLFAHWTWGGGWLAQLGVHYGLGQGFLDAGGSGTIHAVGGLTALSVTWLLGPRRGKYSASGMPAAIPVHQAVMVLFGCLLGLVGWLGMNSAGAILFTGADLGSIPRIGVNTLLTAGAAALTTALVTRARFGKPDASLCANGWVCGLVASSAGCSFLPPIAALVTGAVAGVLLPFGVEWFELRLRVDDPGGAISVHGLGGLWGLLAVGIFAPGSGQWLAQVVGIATLLGVVFPMTYFLNWMLNRWSPQRVSEEGEMQGMDLHELGAGAYPEFNINEDFPLR